MQLTSMLRYVGIVPADRAFFEAGIAWKVRAQGKVVGGGGRLTLPAMRTMLAACTLCFCHIKCQFIFLGCAVQRCAAPACKVISK